MTYWEKRYHSLYLELRTQHDPRVVQWISEKEEIVASSPFSHPLLKHDLQGIRRFKSGKLRIFYAISTEKADFWQAPPQNQEILFLYVDLRKDETYTEALKFLRKHRIL